MLRYVIVLTASILATTGLISPHGLPPGQHSAPPKYWRVLNRNATNYTPLQFDYRIENLTPTPDGGLWFSVGSSIERIEPSGGMTNYAMPDALWQVSSIAYVGGNTWFSVGQSGKVGKIDASHRLSYVQVVPRRFFPDIRDLVVNEAHEMWFLDAGRRSIGYRSASGRLVERPVPDGVWPSRMQHCMGKLWLAGETPTVSRLAVVDEMLKPRWFGSDLLQRFMIGSMSCDGRNNLWLTLNTRSTSAVAYAARISPKGTLRLFALPATWAAGIAADSDGSIWISGETGSRPTLLRIDKNGGTHAYLLPTQSYTPGAIAVGYGGTIWLSIGVGNSPLSIVSIQKS